MNDPIEIAIGLTIVMSVAGGMGMLLLLVRGLVKKWTGPPPAIEGDGVEALRHQIGELGAEVAELQERVDFAERVLSQQGEPPRVAEGRRE